MALARGYPEVWQAPAAVEEGTALTALQEEPVAKLLEASGTSEQGVRRVEEEWDGLVSGTAEAAGVQCKDSPCCSQGYGDMDCILVAVFLGVGFQNLKAGDYLAEKADKYLFPSVKKVEHHIEPSKRTVKTHSTYLGIPW